MTNKIVYLQICEKIYQLLQQKEYAVISIDGMCGSGKTTLSELIRDDFSSRVFHMDDFYLPMEKRANNWLDLCAANIDYKRFIDEVLKKAYRNELIQYKAYRCHKNLYEPIIEMAPTKLSIIEGSYCQNPQISKYYDYKIFVCCSKEDQENRLIIREGEHYLDYKKRWIPLENRYFDKLHIKENSDIIYSTS